MFSCRSAPGLLLFLAGFLAIVNAVSNPPSSAFVYDTSGGYNLTVAVNVPSSGDDLYFHMSAPDGQSWIAFGFGKDMSSSPLIFLAYRSSDGQNITVSPRLANGHQEPQHDPVKDVNVTILAGSGITDQTMTVNAKCSNCRQWQGNSVNVLSTKQPMIIAAYAEEDPSKHIQSDDLSYHITQHDGETQFSMNLLKATGDAGVPVAPFNAGNGTDFGSEPEIDDHHLSRIFHALLMLGSFLLLFPLGVLYLRLLEKVWMHWLNQIFAAFCIVVAAIIGIVLSVKQKISPHLTNPHQILGLVAVSLVLVQLTLGFVHHRMYVRSGTTNPLGHIHRYTGPIVMLVGLANGFLGFHFAGNNRYLAFYGLLIGIVALTMAGALLLKKRRQRRKKAMTSTAAQNFNEAWAPAGQAPGEIPMGSQNYPGYPSSGYHQPTQAQQQYYGQQAGGRI